MTLPRSTVFGPGAAGTDSPGTLPGKAPRTALAVHEGAPRHFEAHLDRLRAAARALGREVSWLAEAGEALRLWLQVPGAAALRLTLDLERECLAAAAEALPAPPSPCRLVALPHPAGDLRSDPLARHKGLSGSWRPPAREAARRLGAEDALLLWPDGTLAETPIATVALERSGLLLLPPPEGRVAGLTERLDLPAWAEARGWRLREAPLTPAECAEGRLWCMNALRGLWPATLL